jgi:hypothetical protein
MIHSQPTAQNTVATKVLDNVLYGIFQSGLFVLMFSIRCCDLEQVRVCHFCSYCLFLFIHSSSSLLCCSLLSGSVSPYLEVFFDFNEMFYPCDFLNLEHGDFSLLMRVISMHC